jgi:hypothetical protein
MEAKELQVRVSPVVKRQLNALLRTRSAGDRINEIAAHLTALEVNRLLASEPKEKGAYATLWVVPTKEVETRAGKLYLDVKAILRAAACKLAIEMQG